MCFPVLADIYIYIYLILLSLSHVFLASIFLPTIDIAEDRFYNPKLPFNYIKWPWRDSNPRPQGCETRMIPSSQAARRVREREVLKKYIYSNLSIVACTYLGLYLCWPVWRVYFIQKLKVIYFLSCMLVPSFAQLSVAALGLATNALPKLSLTHVCRLGGESFRFLM